MFRLHHLPLCPYSRKIRLVLAEKRIEFELVEQKYWEKTAAFLQMNPAGKVPILTFDGKRLSESGAICEYIEDIHPTPALLPKDALQRHEVRRLMAWFDDKFQYEVTRGLLFENVHKKLMNAGAPDSRAVKQAAKNIKHHLDYLTHLLENRRWLAGNDMTLADFTAAAQLSCLDYISWVDWNRSDALKNWYAKIKSRPAFRAVLADQIPGFPAPAHYADLDF